MCKPTKPRLDLHLKELKKHTELLEETVNMLKGIQNENGR